MSTIVQDPIDRHYPPTEQASIWPTALKWGGIAGAAASLVTLISYNVGLMDVGEDGAVASTWLVSFVQYALYVAFIVLGLKAYRDTANAGFLSVGRGVLWSLGFGVALGIVSALFTLLFFYVLAPDYLDILREATLDALEESGVDEATLEMQETMLAYTFSPVTLTLGAIIGSIIPAVIAGAIVSLILRTDR